MLGKKLEWKNRIMQSSKQITAKDKQYQMDNAAKCLPELLLFFKFGEHHKTL